MKITNLENAAQVPFKLDGRVMFTSENNELIHLTLKPGEKLDLHSNPFDVVFYTLSGEGVLNVEGERVEMKTNDTIEIVKGVLRGWENNSTEDLRILVVKIFN
jgi:quercetin dioxygenase-like cupin family protein